MNIQQVLVACEQKIKEDKFAKNLKGSDQANFINNLGKQFGIDKMSMDEPELFDELLAIMNKQQLPQMSKEQPSLFGEAIEKIFESAMLTEAPMQSIPEPQNMLRYDDDTVTATIKELVAGFKEVTLEKIIADNGGAFFNVELTMNVGEEVRENLEAMRFQIAQKMQDFKAKFAGKLSSKLPVVNVKTGSYQMTKNSTTLRFVVTICLSHTNDREWVTGKMKGNGMKEAKKTVNESSASKKHVVQAMPLDTAINDFKSGKSNMAMLQTAIKAAGRSELELYVLKSLGFKMPGADKELPEDNEAKEPDVKELEKDI